MFKTKDEKEIKKLMSKLASYLQNKLRPFLVMGADKNTIRSETIAAINKMLMEVETTPITANKTLEVSISSDTMKIDQTSVTINIDDNPFISYDKIEPIF